VVRFAVMPGGGREEDDKRCITEFIASFPEDRREGALRNLVERATAKMGRRPVAERKFVTESGRVKSEEVAQQIADEHPLALVLVEGLASMTGAHSAAR
jgi:hypothetical protein